MANYVLFTIYDPNTGQVLRSGSCPDTDLDIQHDPDTEALLPDVAADGRIQSIDVDAKQVVDGPVNPVLLNKNQSNNKGQLQQQQPLTEADPIGDLLTRVATLETQVAQLLAK